MRNERHRKLAAAAAAALGLAGCSAQERSAPPAQIREEEPEEAVERAVEQERTAIEAPQDTRGTTAPPTPAPEQQQQPSLAPAQPRQRQRPAARAHPENPTQDEAASCGASCGGACSGVDEDDE